MTKNNKKLQILNILFEAIKLRKVWWFTAWSRTEERFARTSLGSFWLGLSNLLSISLLSVVYGTVFKVDNFKNNTFDLIISNPPFHLSMKQTLKSH